MAELRSTTAIGGNIIWHGGNLRFDPQGETVLYNGHKVFTEHDTPLPGELGNGGTTSAYTKTESDANFAPKHAAGYVKRDGDTMSGKLTTTGNDIEIKGTSPRLTLTDGARQWFLVNDSDYFSIRDGTTSTLRMALSSQSANFYVDGFLLQNKPAFRAYDSWLRINDTSSFASGVYFGTTTVRLDGKLQVGSSSSNGLYASSTFLRYKNGNIFHEAYHPNADRWTTARALTLSGDVSGSVSFDGSADATLAVTVKDDSHVHDTRYYTKEQSDDRFVNVTGDTITGTLNTKAINAVSTASSPFRWQRNSNDQTGQDDNVSVHVDDSNIYFTHNNDADGDASSFQFRYTAGATAIPVIRFSKDSFKFKEYNVFHDTYHPKADKWTNARTLTLSGDVTGSVVFDGSSNVTINTDIPNHPTFDEVGLSKSNPNYLATGRTRPAVDVDTDWNDIDQGGFFHRLSQGPNRPGGFTGYWYAQVMKYGTSENVTQVAYPYGTTSGSYGGGTIAFRSRYSGNWSDWVYMYHTDYHPNADKWTTARTLSLTGDATGSVSFDGSADATLSVSVNDDSHIHNRLQTLDAPWGQKTEEFRTGSADKVSGAPTDEFLNWIQWGHLGGTAYRHTLYSFADAAKISQIWYGYKNNTSDTTTPAQAVRLFADNYHPNADKWTTARTLSLTGDVTASMSVDGSSNASASVSINTLSRSILFSDSDYKGIYFGTKHESGTGKEGSWSCVRQGISPGTIEIGSDNEVNFVETDSYVTRISMTLNDGTLTAVKFKGALEGKATSAAYADNANLLDGIDSTGFIKSGGGAGGADVLNRRDTRDVDYKPSDYGNGVEYHFKRNSTDGFTAGGGTYHRVMNFDAWAGSSGGKSAQMAFGDNGRLATRAASSESAWASWQNIFTDAYHPNADKWTTARTLTLTGNASGSVSIDGSRNVSLSVSVSTATKANSLYVRTSTSSSTYNMLWNSGSNIYASPSSVKIRPSDGYMYLAGVQTTGRLTIKNASPDILLRDTTGSTRGAFLHNNSNKFYVLRTAASSSATTWDSGPNGRHPLTMDLNTGDAIFSGNVTAYSDRKLKTNIENIDDSLSIVNSLNGVRYNWVDDEAGVGRQVGLIAQDLQEVLPEVVSEDENGHLTVAYSNITGVLVEAIKELSSKVETLQSEVHELRKPWWKRFLRL